MYLKPFGANIADPDQTAPEEQSDLGLHSLFRHLSNIYKWCIFCISDFWTVLVENDVSLKTLVAFLAYLLHTGNKVTT